MEQILLGDGLGLLRDRLDVRVQGGVVCLQGQVADRRQQAITVRLARGVEGVIDVLDELQVA